MRTLFITHHYLDGRNGASYASNAYINAFAAISDSLTLLYPENGKEPLAVDEKVEKIPVGVNRQSIVKRAIAFALGTVHRYMDVAPQFISKKYDLVVFDTSVVSFRLIDKFKAAGAKTICIHHNYQYEYFKDNYKGLLRLIELFWCKRYEQEAVQKCDLNLTLTDQDTQVLKSHYGNGKEQFYKLGVFEYEMSKEIVVSQKEDSAIPVFAITGSLASVQTEESLIPWLSEYYPLLKEVFPEHSLLIAGRNPSEHIIQECAKHDKIELIANPANMNDVTDRAHYYICPTSLGGGLKLRIMDGLSRGLPVCTHEVSARGYDEFMGKCLFAYHDAKSFKEAMQNISKCKFDKQGTINLYRSKFSFDAGVERLKSFITVEAIS